MWRKTEANYWKILCTKVVVVCPVHTCTPPYILEPGAEYLRHWVHSASIPIPTLIIIILLAHLRLSSWIVHHCGSSTEETGNDTGVLSRFFKVFKHPKSRPENKALFLPVHQPTATGEEAKCQPLVRYCTELHAILLFFFLNSSS